MHVSCNWERCTWKFCDRLLQRSVKKDRFYFRGYFFHLVHHSLELYCLWFVRKWIKYFIFWCLYNLFKYLSLPLLLITRLTEDGGQCKCNVNLMKIRKSLLQKYIDINTHLELQALFAVQALFVQLDHPPGTNLFSTIKSGKRGGRGGWGLMVRNRVFLQLAQPIPV